MKSHHIYLITGFLTIASALPLAAQSNEKGKVAMKDPANHNQLSSSLRMAQQKDPIRDLGPAIGKVEEDPAKRNASRDLIKDSTILCFRGYLTLVPKRAVLHLPEKLADRFKEQPNIKVQSWQDFYLANRGWIRTVEVTREQAMGLVPLSEDLVETFAKSTSAVVATFKGGPISVLPIKEPEEESPESESSPQSSKN